MKKTFLFSCIALGMMAASCGVENAPTPEDEVRDYAKFFVEKISLNQLDSLKASYPDIMDADSIVALQSDTIMVEETSPGQFSVALTPETTIKVSRSEDGSISVVESRGLFAFPEGKMEMAKKTGMWNDSISDKDFSARIKDDEFFKYMNDKAKKSTSNLISVSKFHLTKEPEFGMDTGAGYYTLTNNTDVEIKSSDYVISMYYEGFYGLGNHREDEPGKDLPPHGTAKYSIEFTPKVIPSCKGIKFTLSDEELAARFAPLTGNEYQEYLDSKK